VTASPGSAVNSRGCGRARNETVWKKVSRCGVRFGALAPDGAFVGLSFSFGGGMGEPNVLDFSDADTPVHGLLFSSRGMP
jgi:hypothetical protein